MDGSLEPDFKREISRAVNTNFTISFTRASSGTLRIVSGKQTNTSKQPIRTHYLGHVTG